MDKGDKLFARRQRRTRRRIRLTSRGRLRLSVFRSARHIYVQIIDDRDSVTLVAASTLDKGLRADRAKGDAISAAAAVGKLVAERARAKGITAVVFDRGGYRFHGRIKALADAAREGGLQF